MGVCHLDFDVRVRPATRQEKAPAHVCARTHMHARVCLCVCVCCARAHVTTACLDGQKQPLVGSAYALLWARMAKQAEYCNARQQATWHTRNRGHTVTTSNTGQTHRDIAQARDARRQCWARLLCLLLRMVIIVILGPAVCAPLCLFFSHLHDA